MGSVSVHAQAHARPRVLPLSGARWPDTWPDAAWVAAVLERLAPLLPDDAWAATRDPLVGSLAYVEQYGHEVPLLEHEWDVLYGALLMAWRRGDDAAVVRLASALARVVGRLRDHRAAECILQLGIGASRRMRDRHHLACMLNRLGGLLCAHGQRARGVRLWHTGPRLAESAPLGLWEPLRSFAVIVDMLRNYAGAHQFVQTIQAHMVERGADRAAESLAVALFARGLHARTMGEPIRAADDFSACLGVLAQSAPSTIVAPDRQLFLMVARAELARAYADYPRAHAYSATALALARIWSDDYTLAALLVDETFYAHEAGQAEDASTALAELRAVLVRMGAPDFYADTHRYLEREVGGAIPAIAAAGSSLTGPASTGRRAPSGTLLGASAPTLNPLSRREREVLRLVASGLSNQDVAARLVVTVGTVKKHLEHIYGKLGVGSRTAAIAQARLLQQL